MCVSSKSLYALKKSFKKAICCDRRVTFLKASGQFSVLSSFPLVSPVVSVHAFGSNGFILYSPDKKSI